ncbi:MAG TPA: M43 family zinc metalloprotease [Bacteroidia bacterium]|nr:M43 family zinc metalloprotease [Bacteroidia bacterium]
MKNLYLPNLFAIILLCSNNISAQNINRCGTMQHLQEMLQQDPGLAGRMQADEMRLQQKINENIQNKVTSTSATIRVIVHVVWNTAPQNISDAQVLSQIDVLNEDYSRTNADTVNTPSVFSPVAANTNIQFCLAGINRVQTTVSSFSMNDWVKSTATGGTDPWDPNYYFNIWVCNLGAGLLGYAQFPGGAPATSGLVMQYNAFGRVGTLQSTYNLGRCATHEIGHCLNLLHLNGSSNCGTDQVSDTPAQDQVHFGCPVHPLHVNVCSGTTNGEMFMNYMDYSDDACLNMFTQGQATRMNAAINTLLPQGILTTGSCPAGFAKIKGTVFYDMNQNGIQDGSDFALINQKLLLLPGNSTFFTSSTGEYSMLVDSGSYTDQFIPKPSWLLTSDSASYALTVDTGLYCCYDFGTFPSVFYDDLEVHLASGPVRCGFDVPFWINYENTGTTILSGIVWMIPDDSLTFVSSIPAPDSTSGDTIFWSFTSLQPGQPGSIYLLLHVPLTQGYEVCSYAEIDLLTHDPVYGDSLCGIVTCSSDPNDKNADPPGILANHYTLKNDTLEYTIRFQNKGTDTAFTVVVIDTLSTFLDLNSFRIIGYSHPVSCSINTQREATFRFDNILLPHESVNEPGSHGFVKFQALPVQGLPDGTVINNTAYIYFDYNVPVVTNNVFNTLVDVLPVGINSLMPGNNQVTIIPQPFNETCEIRFLPGDEGAYTCTVFDLRGQQVFHRELYSRETAGKQSLTLYTKDWIRGMYFFRITSEQGKFNYAGKLLKE